MRESDRPSGAYARYALGLLVVVYVLNFLDRQILSILAERIKADLGLSDAQIGFLYGTAFAVFYALFGIPLGRLADLWVRTRLIALGLGFWSLMTASSAFARSFLQLSAARIGVGVGEASANPAAYALLSDYFSPARRATVLAIYSSGIYIGAGLGLFIGGLIADRWDAAFAAGAAPLGLHGWQVAFLAVGSPGVPLALWVSTLREPRRGQSEAPRAAREPAGAEVASAHTHPFREFARELRAVLPPFTILHLALIGAGWQGILRNLGAAALIGAATVLAIATFGTPPQWIALGIGAYAAVSWAQALGRRDPPAFDMIVRTPTLRFAALGFALLAFASYGIGFWVPPYFVRTRGVSAAEAGLVLGGTAAVAGWLGVTFGGVVADRWRPSNPRARLHIGIIAALAPLPFVVWMLTTESNRIAFTLNFFVNAAASMWIGPGATTVQDLVAPRVRATAAGAYGLVITLIGLALGPYTIGLLSGIVGNLRTAMLLALAANPLAVAMLVLAARHLEADERRLRDL